MMYRHLPPTKELLNAIKVKKASAASKKWIWIATWIAVAGLFFVLACFGLRYLKWFEKDTFNWAVLIPLVVMITAAFTMAVLSIIKDGIFQNPAQRMASEIDAESEVELQFMQTFGRISTQALLDRYQRIEEQLAGREKWLSVARWLGVISAAFIVLSGELGLSANISSGIKICMSALLSGFAVGAILVLVGSAELKRLSIILRKMAERRQADDVRRKQKRGK